MPLSTRKQKQINLLPQGDFEDSVLGRALRWALTTFRIMVIATEMIVMGAFISRFWLDAKNSDLSEEIEIASAQIEAYSDIENEFRTTQKRLSIARNLYHEKAPSTALDEVSKSLPPDIAASTISYVGGGIQIKSRSFSETSIIQFVTNLSSNDYFEDVELSQLSSSIDNQAQINFTITASLSGAEKVK